MSPTAKVALLANDLFPYRMPIYRKLAEEFELRIILSGTEDNRQWNRRDLEGTLDTRYAWGYTAKYARRQRTEVSDLRYLHINPGYLTQLVRFRPDAVISTELGFRTLCALVYSKVFRKPLWIWWGGTVSTESDRSRFKRLARRLMIRNCNSYWISYGNASTQFLLSHDVPAESITQIQNGVDQALFLNEFTPAQVQLQAPIALTVGQAIGRKNIDGLVRSVSRVNASGTPLSLLMVGDGPESKRLDELASQLLGARWLRLSYVPPAQMASIYRAADFFVLPTLEDAWGLVLNEAILSGIPVIASNRAGASEELLPPSHIFDPEDDSQFDDALRQGALGMLSPIDPDVVRPIEWSASRISKTLLIQLYGATAASTNA